MWLTRKLVALATFERKPKKQEQPSSTPDSKQKSTTSKKHSFLPTKDKHKQQQQQQQQKQQQQSQPVAPAAPSIKTTTAPTTVAVAPDTKSTKSGRSAKTGSIKSTNTVRSVATGTSTGSSNDPKTKPLPPLIPSLPPQKVCDKTLVVVISGTLNIGKSTLIRLGLQNLTANYDPKNVTQWQCHRTTMVIDQVHYPMDVIEIDDTMINTDQDPPEFPEDISNVHGGLICYDTTNRDSMDCLPDLLNAYVSRNIPSYLVGLKADLSSLRQVDPDLGRKLGNLFGVELFEVDAFSEEGTKKMKDIYTMLVKRCLQEHGDEFRSLHTQPASTLPSSSSATTSICSSNAGDNESSIAMRERRISGDIVCPTTPRQKAEDDEEPVRRSSFSSDTSYSSDYRFPSLSSKKKAGAAPTADTAKTVTGFVFAPTSNKAAATTASTTVDTTTITPTKSPLDDKSSVHSVAVVPIERKSGLQNNTCNGSRRGSKDSCESMTTGLTVDDIIDKLLTADPPRSDEHIATIFITFFRRFMKPADLARILIDRFDSDSLIEPPPTRLQERIQAIFLIWLNSYWNDFHSRRTRKLITKFLNRISKEQVLRPISDSLRPLIGRLPPVEDPDAHWGMVDDQDDDDDSDSDSDSDDDIFEECEPVPTAADDVDQEEEEEAPAVTSKNKKDSGYSADSFSVFGFFGVGGGSHSNNNETKDTQDSKSISEGCKLDEAAPPLKRTSSSSSFSLFGRSRKSSISSSFGFLFGLSPMTAAKPEPQQQQQQPSPPEKKEKPVQQSPPPATPEPTPVKKVVNTPAAAAALPPSRPKSPALSISSSTHSLRRRPSIDVRSTTDGKNSDKRASRAEFAGGLINIDLHCGMSTSPSWTSFGANTVASSTTSYMSTFGNNNHSAQPRNEKEANNQIYKMMMDIPDSVIANQLTWIEAELFGKIKAREFIRNIWAPGQQSRPSSVSSEDQIKAGSAVVASIAHFNFISAWVATMIVTQAKVNKRAALLQKFMSIAVELRNHNNYNSLMAVLAGLNSAPVLRLKQTREAMTDKKIYKQFQSLERLMSSDRSFSSYRLALKASEPPGVPYLGIHNQDLISLAEGNKDFRADGTIHWDKFRLMGECIVAMMKFQCPAYDIEPDGRILRFIADSEILSEDEQYKRSNLVEPRLKSSSTNRLRDLWLRM